MYSGKEGAASLIDILESLAGLSESDSKIECCITNVSIILFHSTKF